MTETLVREIAARLDRHLSERDFEQGCRLACGYDGDDRSQHIAEDLVAHLTLTLITPPTPTPPVVGAVEAEES